MKEVFVVPEEFRKGIPDRSIRKLEGWINYGGDLSGFWYQLLSGDLYTAACNADGDNLLAFGEMLRFLEISAPSECFGSPEKVRDWAGQR